MKKRSYSPSMRYPRTTQEMRSYCDPDPRRYSRAGRHHLPNCYDDIWVRMEKSWKSRRKQQYHIDKTGYALREFQFHWSDQEAFHQYRNIWEQIVSTGCWWRYYRGGIQWYGPDFQ